MITKFKNIWGREDIITKSYELEVIKRKIRELENIKGIKYLLYFIHSIYTIHVFFI